MVIARFVLPLFIPLVAAHAQKAEPANYVYELWYQVHTNKSQQWTRYFTKLQEADFKIGSSRRRWVDTHPWSNARIVGLPVARLADYDSRPDSATVFRQAFGDEEYQKHSAEYRQAQISRTSYLRRYRNDLSLNRERHERQGIKATAYSFVTLLPGKNAEFEEAWRRALEAYRKLAPAMILTVAETLAGGGPDYVIARPLKNYAEFETDLAPESAIERAFGKPTGRAFNGKVSESVAKWETFIFDRTNLDTN